MRIFLCVAVLVIQALLAMATRGALKEENMLQKAIQERENAGDRIHEGSAGGNLVKAVLWMARVFAVSALLGMVMSILLFF